MTKKFLLLLSPALLLLSTFANAQDNDKPNMKESFWDKVYIGGNFGLQFGTYTVIDLSPNIGYKITDKLSAGIGITYIYFKYKDPNIAAYSYSTDIYGGSLFTRYFIIESLFTHVEYEVLNLEEPVYDKSAGKYVYGRINVGSFFVGGGLRQPLGENSSLTLMLLYNLNETHYSPYQNPIIRVGFGFGI